MSAIGARYRRLATLSEGAGRVTVTAQDRLLGLPRVLKLAVEGTPAAVLLRAEADRLAALHHPGLVGLVDRLEGVTGLDPGGPVSGFAMAWIDGEPLGRGLAELPLPARLQAFGALVEVVEYLHRCGLLHLDIKPGNVLRGRTGVWVLDLGTARPVHAGPGEAGGTLGYAAPEVLQGHAAGPAADTFSLGALLYELLTGERPYGEVSGGALRQAVLEGAVIPLRARRPDLPPALGRLVDAMLAVAVTDRPGEGVPLRDALAEAGIPVPPPRGAPPFAGREEELARLTMALRRPGQTVVVVGPQGSGRRRLVGELVARGELRCLDLSGHEDPTPLLERLAGAPHEVGALAQQGGLTLVMGHHRARSEELAARIEGPLAAMTQAGARALWTAERDLPGAVSVPVGPLEPGGIIALGQFYGQPVSWRLSQLLGRTGGWPGALVRALSAEPLDVPPALDDAWQVLAGLPEGTPADLLERLPADVVVHLPALVSAGLARRDAAGRLFVVRPARTLPADPALREVLLRLSDAPGTDPLWGRLVRARLDLPVALAPLLPSRLELPADRLAELADLAELQSARGDPDAWRILAAVHLRMGDASATLADLNRIGDPDPIDHFLRASACRRCGQTQQAQQILEAHGQDMPVREALLERARCALALRDLDDVGARVEQLLALPGGRNDPDARLVQALWLDVRWKAGLSTPGVDELDAWVAAHPDLGSDGLRGPLGRLAEARGDLDAAHLHLLAAVRYTDREGFPRPAIGSRVNLAEFLVRRQRPVEARRTLEQALLLARRAHEHLLTAQVVHNLARIDLRAGRLPDVRAHLAEYDRLVRGVSLPEVHLRGALNRAWLMLLDGAPGPALEELDRAPTVRVSPDGLAQREHLRAWALLELDRPDEALAAFPQGPDRTREIAFGAQAEVLRGRAHLALGRRHLAAARAALPGEEPDSVQTATGQVLLAWAGEDLDPDSFPDRRQALVAAARHLRGAASERAVRLRERLLDGPGANLDGIVALTEAMHDPRAFPQALARLVREALGAHRVLIMLRVPGLGHQLGYTELSGAQAAGIGREVMLRIQHPDDVWLSGDAFADIELRESSQTVQTFELKSLLAVAIPRGDRAVGALYVDDMYRANRFGAEDVDLLRRLAGAVGRMIPLMRGEVGPELPEPIDVLGVLVANPAHQRQLTEALEMLDARTEGNVLITGPTGAGKSVLARRMAQEVLGCTGVEVVVLRKADPQMLITQLMGSKRGEFTGATDREGAITRCLRERKALFLDEVQNLDEAGQQILLPLLDLPRSFGGLTGSARPLGGPLHILLGTNHDVSGARTFDVFRSDLWFRMSRAHLHLPALAERGEEVVYRYLARMLESRGAPPPEDLLETSALYRVTHGPWPGNLRELDAFADRLVVLATNRGRRLADEDLATLRLAEDHPPRPEGDEPGPRRDSVEGLVIRHVLTVLRKHEWTQKAAAEELGWNAPALNKFLKRHGLLDEVRRRRTGPP